jgi:hypothetical protein
MLNTQRFATSCIPGPWGPVAGPTHAPLTLLYGLLRLQTASQWGKAVVYVSSPGLQLFFLYTYAVGHWVG